MRIGQVPPILDRPLIADIPYNPEDDIIPTRKRWVNDLVMQASDTLTDAHWSIKHPADWPGQECLDLKARLSNEFECFPTFEPQRSISAGLRITAGGACVDGSNHGLLQGRTRIEAMLLARIRKHMSAEPEAPGSDEKEWQSNP